MKAKNFDKKFDDNKQDIIDDLDLSTAKRPNQKQKRINVNFPSWVKLQPTTIVRHPALNILLQAYDSRDYGYTRASSRDAFQFPFEYLNLAIQCFQLLPADLKPEY